MSWPRLELRARGFVRELQVDGPARFPVGWLPSTPHGKSGKGLIRWNRMPRGCEDLQKVSSGSFSGMCRRRKFKVKEDVPQAGLISLPSLKRHHSSQPLQYWAGKVAPTHTHWRNDSSYGAPEKDTHLFWPKRLQNGQHPFLAHASAN